MFSGNFKSIADLTLNFSTEAKCIEFLEQQRWNGNVISPFDSSSKVWKCKGHKYMCANTGKYFNVKTGTLFDNTKISLQKWFIAIWLLTSHKKGVSSMQLGRDLGITHKSAWFLSQRIRNCFCLPDEPMMDGPVEVDETFVGGKNINRHKNKKVKYSQGRSYKDKTPVFGMLQRGGRLMACVVPDTSAHSIQPIIFKNLKMFSYIISDEWNAYRGLSKYYFHDIVRHGIKEYVNMDNPSTHTNTIEGFWGIFKRGMKGIYNSVSRKHMQKYVDEFVFRYNTRKESESERFCLFLCNICRRLKYADLIATT